MNLNLQDTIDIIQKILDVEFSHHEKRKIEKRDTYFSFACPICGDSEKNVTAKRGTLYHNSLFYECFNCDYRSNILGLANTFGIHIDLNIKLNMIEYVNESSNRMSFSHEDFFSKDFDKLLDIPILSEFFNNNEKSFLSDFHEITKGSMAYEYLMDRNITDFACIFEATFWHNSKWYEPVIVFLNMSHKSGKVIGIQIRNLKKEKIKRFYKIISFSEIYNLIFEDNPIDDIEAIRYNKLSYLFNIMNIDLSSPITIFEGYLDTKFFPNSIGMVGKNTDPGFLIMQEDLDIRFFFDYDAAGMKKSIEYLELGQRVFLWEKMFRFWSGMTREPNLSYRRMTDGRIVDLNNIGVKMGDVYKKLELDRWFSNDMLDKFYIKLNY